MIQLADQYYNLISHSSNGTNTILLDANNKIVAYHRGMCDWGDKWEYVRADCQKK